MLKIFSTLRRHLHFILTVSILTVAMTWPTIVFVFNTDVFWLPVSDSDVWMKFWDAWYGKLIITGQADFYFTDLLFYPHGLSLVYHNFSVPHMLVFGGLQAIMPASNAFNLTYLLIIFSTTGSAYIYLCYLLQDKWLALLGAVIFGFSQHVLGHSHHPDIGFIATLPLALYFFHRGILEQRGKWMVISGALVGLTVFIGMYIFVCLLLTMGMYILGFAISRWKSSGFWLQIALLLFAVGCLSIVRIYPMIDNLQALDSAVNKRTEEDATDLLAYFVNYRHPIITPMFYTAFDITPRPPITPFRKTSVHGWRHTSYLGYLPLVLIGFGLFGAACRRKMLPWLMLMLPFLVLRLGAVLRINNQKFPDLILPKHYLNELFPAIFRVFHEADHFQTGVLLPLAICSCYGLMTMLKLRRRWVILLAAAVIAFEYYHLPYATVIDVREFAYMQWLDEQENRDAIRLIHLPMGRIRSKHYGLHQTLTGYPQAEGLASRTPQDAYAYIEENLLLNMGRQHSSIQCSPSNQIEYLSALDNLAKDGFSHIVLHDKSRLSASLVAVEPSYSDKFVTIYRLEDLHKGCPEFIPGYDLVAHYQHLFFSPTIVPRYETILSFHPTERITNEAFSYYSKISSQEWKSLVHIWHNTRNEIIIQSSNPKFSDQGSIVGNNDAIWLIYNPQQSHPQTIGAYAEWFSQYYKPCRRFLERDDIIVDYYLRTFIPCELVDAESPLKVIYDSSIQLSNVVHDIDSRQAAFYLWWSNTVIDHPYAYSIQIFNKQGEKVRQVDDVIRRDAIAFDSIDISMLDEGAYAVRLIVYDFVTKASQSGHIHRTQQLFERDLEIAQFAIRR